MTRRNVKHTPPPASQAVQAPADLLPRLIEVERALAGTLVQSAGDAAVVATVRRIVDEAAFTDSLSRLVVASVFRRNAAGQIADYVTIAGDLRTDGRFESADLTGLVSESGPGEYAEHYARQVAAVALRRRMIEASGEAAKWAYAGDPDIAGMAVAIKALFDPLQPVSDEDGGLEIAIQRFLAGESPRDTDPTGIPLIDESAGGIAPGDFVVIAGWTGLGKTHLAVTIANAMIDAGRRVMFAELEMSVEQMVARLMYNRVGAYFPTREGATYRPEVIEAARILSDPDRIQVLGSLRTATAISARAVADGAEVVIVDHGQLLLPPPGVSSGDLYAVGTANATELMTLAKSNGIAVVALSQISGEANKAFAVGARGSGMGTKGTKAWQENADLGIQIEGIWDDTGDKNSHRAPDALRLTIAKGRHGTFGTSAEYIQDGASGRLKPRPRMTPPEPLSWLEAAAGRETAEPEVW